jgi:hypothetical protein
MKFCAKGVRLENVSQDLIIRDGKSTEPVAILSILR